MLARERLASIRLAVPIVLVTTVLVFLSGELWWSLGYSQPAIWAIAVALLITTLWWLLGYSYGALLRSIARRGLRARDGFTPTYLANFQTALMGPALLTAALLQAIM